MNELPQSGEFDTQFITHPNEIIERKHTVKYNPSAGIELKLDGAVVGVENKITAEVNDAKRYIKIRCDDNCTWVSFIVLITILTVIYSFDMGYWGGLLKDFLT